MFGLPFSVLTLCWLASAKTFPFQARRHSRFDPLLKMRGGEFRRHLYTTNEIPDESDYGPWPVGLWVSRGSGVVINITSPEQTANRTPPAQMLQETTSFCILDELWLGEDYLGVRNVDDGPPETLAVEDGFIYQWHFDAAKGGTQTKGACSDPDNVLLFGENPDPLLSYDVLVEYFVENYGAFHLRGFKGAEDWKAKAINERLALQEKLGGTVVEQKSLDVSNETTQELDSTHDEDLILALQNILVPLADSNV